MRHIHRARRQPSPRRAPGRPALRWLRAQPPTLRRAGIPRASRGGRIGQGGHRKRGDDPPEVGADEADEKQDADELQANPPHRVSVRPASDARGSVAGAHQLFALARRHKGQVDDVPGGLALNVVEC